MMLIYLLSFFTGLFMTASNPEPVKRWIVELNPAVKNELGDWHHYHMYDMDGYYFKKLPFDHWYVLDATPSSIEELRQYAFVNRVYEDLPVSWRREPNDPAYINQQDMNLIGMPKAWDITTGGITAYGDTIVVAIIDEGYEINHPDLIDNIWHNYDEIPGDGIDNDENGYKDDYTGYNVKFDNDQHAVSHHGTSVAGIIGGVGNNDVGITGVNWNVKLLLMSGALQQSEIILAYQYMIDMRNLYEATNGEKGAFIVASNLSAGIDGAHAIDFPLWCMMYDKLGEEGILSVCAAPNNPINVDEDGDMPTTCSSPFMIAVTNVDLTDNLVENAGFGPLSIDMAAPGHGTVTTSSGMTYKEFPGTSAATPHVTGAIALMYSTPCPLFLDDLDSDPEGVASKVRDIIFATARLNNSLEGITLTERRLQVDGALRATVSECDPQTENSVAITFVEPNFVQADGIDVGFDIKGDTTNVFFELYSMNGARLAHYELTPEQFLAREIHLNTRSLPAAMYVLTLRSGKLKSSRKFVVL